MNARPCAAKVQIAVIDDKKNSGRRNRSTGNIGAWWPLCRRSSRIRHCRINASVIVAIGPTLNTDPTHPVQYAVQIDQQPIQFVQPIPTTVLGSYGSQWTQMVSNFSTFNVSTFTNVRGGAHSLNLWAVTPSVTFQKVVVNLGGLRDSYMGPPESLRVGV